MASALVMLDYGNPHMGCPIDLGYRNASFQWMGTIGDRIRLLRKAHGLTQPVLAKLIGIDQSTLSDIERGAGFSAETLMQLAEHLEATCEYIMRGQVSQSENLRKAQQAFRVLSDEERVELFAEIQQPARTVSAAQAEAAFNRARTKPKPAKRPVGRKSA